MNPQNDPQPENVKIFTVDEANQLIPQLTQLIGSLHEYRDALLRDEVEIDALELISGGKKKEGVSHELENKLEEYQRTVARFYAIIDEIQQTGCHLKDINMGLVDFYTYHQGQMVFLCWKLGESAVHFWHEIGRGYTYRQPLDEADVREEDGER